MGKKLVVKLDLGGIAQLKKTAGVDDYLQDLAAPRTPDGCEAKLWKAGTWTHTVVIHPATKKAEQQNLENNTLLKGIGS